MLRVEKLGVVLAPDQPGTAKFNAGMLRDGEVVHMVYRLAKGRYDAAGKLCGYEHNGVAYARLDTEGRLLHDAGEEELLAPPPGIHYEDPRIVRFEGVNYLFYTVYDGEMARVGVAATEDFRSASPLGVIPTDLWDKDAFILPERVNGRIVYIHRIEPAIQVDAFDAVEDLFDPDFWADYGSRLHDSIVIKGEQPWECRKVGGSVPPIRTEAGWLFIYHGVGEDREPFCYRAGAALLDLRDPARVTARLPYPLFEPDQPYETAGDVNHVVFPQGAYEYDGWLYISYGAADTRVAMARVRMDDLLAELDKHRFDL